MACIDFTDGDFLQLLEVAALATRRPFINAQVKDVDARYYERIYEIAAAAYVPAAALSTDPADATAYLVYEDVAELPGELLAVTLRYARIPAAQVSYHTRTFSRPNIDGLTSGGYTAVSFDDGATAHLFSALKTVNAIAALVADSEVETGSTTIVTAGTQTGTVGTTGSIPRTGTVTVASSGGAYTRPPFDGSENFEVTGAVGTQTINTFDSAGTILTAIQAATGSGSINYSVVVGSNYITIQYSGSGSGNFRAVGPGSGGSVLDFAGTSGNNILVQRLGTAGSGSGTDTYATTDTPATTDAHSLSQAGSATQTPALTRTYAVPKSVRRLTINSHGSAVGAYVALLNGGRIVAKTLVVTVVDANNVDVPLADVDGKEFVAAQAVFSSAAIARYVLGLRECTIKRTVDFYLPGVTPGITTGADVPQVTLYADPLGWLAAMVSWLGTPTTFAAITAGELDSWMGPILHRTTEAIQMSDAMETTDINAAVFPGGSRGGSSASSLGNSSGSSKKGGGTSFRGPDKISYG